MHAHVAEQQDLRFFERVEQQNALDVQLGEPTTDDTTTDTDKDTTNTDENTTDTD
jgi:hypothetical protein